jgi:hypothetical protein
MANRTTPWGDGWRFKRLSDYLMSASCWQLCGPLIEVAGENASSKGIC